MGGARQSSDEGRAGRRSMFTTENAEVHREDKDQERREDRSWELEVRVKQKRERKRDEPTVKAREQGTGYREQRKTRNVPTLRNVPGVATSSPECFIDSNRISVLIPR